MLISDFDYELPPELIARFPSPERTGSRLLEVGQQLRDRPFRDLTELLNPGDLLVFNDTKVIKARLAATKATGGKAEILIERALSTTEALAHVRASKTPKPGSRLQLAEGASAEVVGRDGELFRLRFSVDVMALLEEQGDVPLPPYLERSSKPADAERYQTVYARDPGAVAAPTAGLHFDDEMMDATLRAGARHAWVTLHVGAGTFQSLRREHIEENRLHSERVHVGAECCEAVRETRAAGGRVIAIGTTTVRSLECASVSGELKPFDGETDLFILPGFCFRTVDALLTNFHLPKSSLLMLVSAFAGTDRIRDAYRHAVAQKYRFFSYGDAMYLTPPLGVGYEGVVPDTGGGA